MASKELLASKVVFTEAGQAIPENFEAPTAIASGVMVTERGPVGEATRSLSWGDWQKVFGGYIATSHGPECVANFFGMGGRIFYTVRTVHYTDITNPATATSATASKAVTATTAVAQPAIVATNIAEPYNLSPGDTLDFSINGGGTLTATFTATSGISTSGNTEDFVLVDGMTLTLKLDGGSEQTFTFLNADFSAIGAAKAWEVANKINQTIVGGRAFAQAGAVVIGTDTLGSGGSAQITGGTSNAILAFPTTVNSGTGNVADITGVTVAEIKTIVEAAVAGTLVSTVTGGKFQVATVATGSTETIQVLGSSTADTKLGLDNVLHTGSDAGTATTFTAYGKTPGAYANSLYIEITNASSGDATEFNLNVKTLDVILEYHPNLSMTPTDDRYAVTIISEDSNLISLVDAGTGSRPTNATYGALTGGDDGLAGLVDADYVGDSGGGTGLHALTAISILNMIAVPGITSSVVQNGLVNYCLTDRGGIPVAFMATPEGSDAAAAVTHVETAGILELADCSVIFWPWVKVANPSNTIYGTDSLITTSPEGIMMGRAAITDVAKAGGVYQSPAGLIYGVLNIVLGIDSEEANQEIYRDLVYPKRINPIHKDDNTPYYNDGSKTLKNSTYPTIGERRGRSKIELDLVARFNSLRHLPATKETRKTLERVATTYLTDQMNDGAFTSKVPSEAFAIDAGDGINPPSEEEKGILNVDIDVRMAGSYQWVNVRFSNTFGTTSVEA